ncbi:hypothetical protein D3H55_14965 [Bacillus salacetis]|uniref:Uncharacterized protein n=1 Tax=Bacillus salacetis TaxID=2315464 RepID=A0A3A1QUF5_9BACI|nr:hypothetical protein [Bacillus salacetis]RIW31596.1 hypothetical protein D3H55_14965 [Bacillus salacetis]
MDADIALPIEENHSPVFKGSPMVPKLQIIRICFLSEQQVKEGVAIYNFGRFLSKHQVTGDLAINNRIFLRAALICEFYTQLLS